MKMGHDWVTLVNAAEPKPFLSAIQAQLCSNSVHFKAMQQNLSTIFFKQVDQESSLDFLLSCLELLILGREGADAAGQTQPTAVATQATCAASCNNADGSDAACSPTSLQDAQQGQEEGMEQRRQQQQQGQQLQGQQPAPVSWSGTLSHLLLELIQQHQQHQKQLLRRQKQQQQQHQQAPRQQQHQLLPIPVGTAGDATTAATAAAAAAEAVEAAATESAAVAAGDATTAAAAAAAAAAATVVVETAAEPGAAAVPPSCGVVLSPGQRQRVLRLFAACCGQPRHARVALKLAQAFELGSADVADPAALAAAVSELLSDRVTLTPGLGLVMHFQALLSDLVDRPALLSRLVLEGKEAAAEKWAAGLGREDQVTFVRTCIAADRLKAAAQATRLFGLKQEFPDIEARYRRASLAKLASKRVWSVAASWVGTDVSMQMELLQQMVAAGEAGLAEEYRKRFGLPAEVLALDPAQLAEQEAARAERYLPLELPPGGVLFVDGPAGLRAAAAALAGARVVGIDVEWKAAGGGDNGGSWGTSVDEDEGEGGREGAAGEEESGRGEEAEAGAEGEEEEGEEGEEGGGAWRRRRRRWRNGGDDGGGGKVKSPASLLQVATYDTAVLFDLLALCGGSAAAGGGGGVQCTAAAAATAVTASDGGGVTAVAAASAVAATAAAAPSASTDAGYSVGAADPDGLQDAKQEDLDLDLDSVLVPLFGPGGALVLGFGLSGDLSKLASSYPHVAAFQRVSATLDLYDMWKAYVTAQAQAARPKNAPPVSLPSRAFQAGLSTLAAALLGKPLDKTMQVSDWEARPLSPRQLTYAAQDAHVLVRLWEVFQQRLPPGLAEAVARERTTAFTSAAAAAAGAASPQKQRQRQRQRGPAGAVHLTGEAQGAGVAADGSGGGGGDGDAGRTRGGGPTATTTTGGSADGDGDGAAGRPAAKRRRASGGRS